MLKESLNKFLGKRKPHWGLESQKPYWWPSNVPFVSPKNNRNEGRPKKDALKQIIEAFMASITAQEVDDIEEIDDEGDKDEENDEIEEICSTIESVSTHCLLNKAFSFHAESMNHVSFKKLHTTNNDLKQFNFF